MWVAMRILIFVLDINHGSIKKNRSVLGVHIFFFRSVVKWLNYNLKRLVLTMKDGGGLWRRRRRKYGDKLRHWEEGKKKTEVKEWEVINPKEGEEGKDTQERGRRHSQANGDLSWRIRCSKWGRKVSWVTHPALTANEVSWGIALIGEIAGYQQPEHDEPGRPHNITQGDHPGCKTDELSGAAH